ncbi:MAG: glycoside-pentoside-hexuronide (GPH):cation symporter [Spirochaetota bacterium]
MNTNKLPISVKIGFGVCDLGGNMFYTITAFWLMNYLTDTVGLAASLAGISLMLVRVWDAVADPVVGLLSDRTRSRWGRRRPFIFFGSIALFIAMIVMFTAPAFTGQTALFIWATAAYLFLYFSNTVVSIPYSSLTPELTRDYNERTSLNGFRMSFAVVGTLIGAGTFLPLVGAFGDRRLGHTVTGALFGAIMLMTALITFASVREQPAKKLKRMPAFASYRSALTSGPFLIIVLTWMLATIAVTIISGTLIYYFKYIYSAPDSAINTALIIMLLAAMISIPLWVMIAKKVEKKFCYAAGMALLAAAVIVFYFFGERGGVPFAYVTMGISGFALATHYVFPWSIVPDAIEYDRVKTKQEREGLFYGLWTFVSKLGGAFAGLVMGAVFSLSGYLPNIAQSTSAKDGIKLLFGPIAAVFFIAAAVVLLFYPIDSRTYAKLRAR